MKTIIAKLISVVLMVPLIPTMLVGFIPYALFKGITDEFVYDTYFRIWERLADTLLYPYNKYRERKENLKELERKVESYRETCHRLNSIIEELEKKK